MDTGETPVSLSWDEDTLLDFNVAEKPKNRILGKPWAKSTKGDKQIYMDWINYYMKGIEYVNKCWASGPTTDSPPIPPESSIEDLVIKSRKRKGKASSNTDKSTDNLVNKCRKCKRKGTI
jgi:hypothetical protein